MFDSLTTFFTRGGLFMVPLIICSVISLTVILERGFALMRNKIIDFDLADSIHVLRHGQKPETIERLTSNESTVLARLVRSCLRNQPWSKFENTEALQTKARAEISKLERGLVILEIMVGIGPLLGLLGTVMGLITIFGNVGDQSVATQGIKIAAGIAEALNTTVAGLCVAIPSMIAFSIYTRRVEGFAVELESICVDLLGKLYTEATDATVSTTP
jgi:biopolymer transport protein ExbB